MTTPTTKKRPAAAKPTLDFPKRAEKVASETYTLRLTVPPGVKRVEISINDGPWQACREAAGHWWYDWSGYANGRHSLTARHETVEGRWIAAEPRNISVEVPLKPSL